jgi:hypothetical protein
MSYGNLTSVPNSIFGGNIVTVLSRAAIRAKAAMASAVFRAKVSGLRIQGGEMEYVPPCVKLGTIPISVKKQETYAYRADITQHAVEIGANLSDHIIMQPLRVDVSFEVTNWDLAMPQQANEAFVKMMNDRIPLDLQTEHGILKDMVLISYQAENTMPNWGALDCKASFIQVKFVSLEVIKMPATKVAPTANTGGGDVSKSASSATQRGPITPKDVGNNSPFPGV